MVAADLMPETAAAGVNRTTDLTGEQAETVRDFVVENLLDKLDFDKMIPGTECADLVVSALFSPVG